MKKCTICKQDKNLTCFNKNKSRKDGLNTICRKCSNARSRQYYQDNKKKHKQVVMKRTKQQRKKNQEFILEYLSKNYCIDCQENDIRVLEFDHLPQFQKKENISTLVRNGYSIETIKKEISKCEVVCANCHRIRTHKSQGSYRIM